MTAIDLIEQLIICVKKHGNMEVVKTSDSLELFPYDGFHLVDRKIDKGYPKCFVSSNFGQTIYIEINPE